MSKLTLTKEEATKEIKAVKQCNMVAREKRAKLRGFASSKLYLDALQAIVDGKVDTNSGKSTGKKKKTSKAGEKPVIYIFDCIDTSGSMGSGSYSGSRMAIANQGLNQGIAQLKKEQDKLGVIYKHVLVRFWSYVEMSSLLSIDRVQPVNFTGSGSTLLNDAIVQAVDRAIEEKSPEEKALINIYTDGGENGSKASDAQAKAAIKKAEENGITVTFIGTVGDTQSAIRSYGLHESNTMIYDGTAKGMSMSMQETSSARSTFSKKVVAGEDVKTGFYKKIVK